MRRGRPHIPPDRYTLNARIAVAAAPLSRAGRPSPQDYKNNSDRSSPIVLSARAGAVYPILFCCRRDRRRPAPPDRVEVPRRPVLLWNETALQAIKEDRTPPPMAARNLAILHAAIYDAVNAIDRTHAVYHVDAAAPAGRVDGGGRRRGGPPRPDAALPEAGEALRRRPGRLAAPAAGQAGPGRRPGPRRERGGRMLAWRADDGAGRKGPFVSESAPGLWEPTPPDFKPPLLPHWARGDAVRRAIREPADSGRRRRRS